MTKKTGRANWSNLHIGEYARTFAERVIDLKPQQKMAPNGNLIRQPRMECKLCGGKMKSFKFAICYPCHMLKEAAKPDKEAQKIEVGKALMAIEARKKEIAAIKRRR